MGIFDFFKKKKVENVSSRQIQNSDKETVSITSTDSNAPSLSKEERYGRASLVGYKTQNWSSVLVEFQKLENEGFGEASIALGQFAQINDRTRALEHFKKAAAAGIAEGAWGCAAIIGHGYIADITGKDKLWYQYCLNSAQGGCCDAMNELGNMYNRKGDFLAAYYWYQMAAYYEHPQGYASVAGTINKWAQSGKPALSSSIDGVRPNDVKNAISIFRCLTQQDKLDQQRMDQFMHAAMDDDNEIMGLFIGHFFEDTVKMDGNAKMGYQLAAHNNSIMGMKCLADMLAAGRGCERNMQNAFGWYQGAAGACEKTACFVMGEFTRQQNRNLAAYWYSVAFRRGYEPALTRLQQM